MVTQTIDEVLNIIGPFNKYQWKLILMLAYCFMVVSLPSLNMTFIANDPGWKCSGNTTFCNHTGVITTTMSNYNDRCNMERKDWTFPEGPTSIVTEFELVCERSILKNIATSMVYMGWFIGNIVNGYISDKIGRKRSLFISLMLMSLAGFVSSFVKLFWLFSVLRAVVGFGLGGAKMSLFILSTEFVGPKKRGLAGNLIWNFYNFGSCLIAPLAYLIPNWKVLNLVTSAPGFLAIIINLFLPESVRWLLVDGQINKVNKLLRNIADTNGRKYPKDVKFHESETARERESIFEMFRDRSLVLHTFVLMALWFTSAAIFYGTFLSAGQLGGNIYLVFFLTVLASFPAHFITVFLIERFGRKQTLMLTLLGTSCGMIAAALTPTSTTSYIAVKVTFAIAAKLLITITYNATYVIAFEILPTTSRNFGMGLTASAARIGSFSSAYVTYLGQINPILPFIVLGSFAVISALLCLILPETKGNATRETTKDVDKTPGCVENGIDNVVFTKV